MSCSKVLHVHMNRSSGRGGLDIERTESKTTMDSDLKVPSSSSKSTTDTHGSLPPPDAVLSGNNPPTPTCSDGNLDLALFPEE
jgi:hypothetical protein